MSLKDANELAALSRLNISIKGSISTAGSSYAKTQDIAPDTEVPPFTVVKVTFNQDNSIL